MFRFDNPDALLTLLLVAGAYCVVRAVEAGRTTWLLLAGTAVGFAFLTKMLQAFLVLPAFALVYLVAAPVALRRRDLAAAGRGAGRGGVRGLVGARGHAVAGWRRTSAGRPTGPCSTWCSDTTGWAGSSAARATAVGAAAGRVAARPARRSAGPPGCPGLFSSEMGQRRCPGCCRAAIVALVGGLWVTRRRLRTDRTRAALLLWGGWALVTGLTFSYMSGTIHPYYTVALAPALGALVAVGGREFWAPAGVAGRAGC